MAYLKKIKYMITDTDIKLQQQLLLLLLLLLQLGDDGIYIKKKQRLNTWYNLNTDTLNCNNDYYYYYYYYYCCTFLQKKMHIPLCAKHKIILSNGKKWPKLYFVSLGGVQRSPLLRHVMTDRLYHRSDAWSHSHQQQSEATAAAAAALT